MMGRTRATQNPVKTGLAHFGAQVQQPSNRQAAEFGGVVTLSEFSFWVLNCRILPRHHSYLQSGTE